MTASASELLLADFLAYAPDQPSHPFIGAASIDVERLQRDLHEAALDADRYAVSVNDMLRTPPSKILTSPAMAELLQVRLLALVGCLQTARKNMQRLDALGVIV